MELQSGPFRDGIKEAGGRSYICRNKDSGTQKEQEKVLFSLCEISAFLWNVVNYNCRQSLFAGGIDWDTKEEYNEFKRILGSATAQLIIRKNYEARKSFLKMLKLKKQSKLPKHICKVSPLKGRLTGKRSLMTVIKNDCYRINEVENKKLFVFRGLRIRITGDIRWRGSRVA